MSFISYPNKPLQEIILSRKTVSYQSIALNSNYLSLYTSQGILGLVSDSKLTFNEHIKHVLSEVNKSIRLLCKFEPVVPIPLFLTVYKTFSRSHLNYADVVCDQSYKSSFQ